MKIVLFLEWKRYKKKIYDVMLATMVSLICLFLVGALLDKIWPNFNERYMNWPEYMKNLIGLSGWSSNLWYNFWQILAVLYPFLHFYVMMNMLSGSLRDEKKLETIVYLRNAGVDFGDVIRAKALFWLSVSSLLCLLQFLAVTVLLVAGGMSMIVAVVWRYYLLLIVISLLYVAIALTLAADGHKNRDFENAHLSFVLLPWLMAKVPDVIAMFGRLLELTGRSETIVMQFEVWEQRTAFLRYISPIAWCVPEQMEVLPGIWCGYASIAVILFLIAFKMYKNT